VNIAVSVAGPPPIAQLQDNDPQAWSWCVAEFGEAVQRYASSAGHRDPSDVVGAVFETLVRRIHDFDGDITQLRSFAFTVAHARIVDDYRRRHRHHGDEATDPDDLEQIAHGDFLRPESSESGILTRQILNAIADLAPFQREVIELRYVHGLGVDEVAQRTNRSPGAVRTATSRGLQQLRNRLAPNRES
jgi:RNA polymerase sigma factor (sigma-70 family)